MSPRPGRPRWHDPRPAIARVIGALAAPFQRERADEPDTDEADTEEPIVPSDTPSPLRDPVTAQRSEVRRAVADDEADAPEGRELRRPGSVDLVEDTQVWSERIRPIATPRTRSSRCSSTSSRWSRPRTRSSAPSCAAARTRIGLTVDQLAERTRIRPHVIESIEVDDFAPCGGDFYARGHLRTLARVLGIDARRCWRRTTSGTPMPRSTPAACSRPSWRPAPRVDPRHPRRAQLVGPGRRRDGAGAGLVGRAAGHGQPGRAARHGTDPQRFGGPGQRRPQGGAGRAGGAERGRRRRPRGGPGRLREGRLQRRSRVRRDHRRSRHRRRCGCSPRTARWRPPWAARTRGALGKTGQPAQNTYAAD